MILGLLFGNKREQPVQQVVEQSKPSIKLNGVVVDIDEIVKAIPQVNKDSAAFEHAIKELEIENQELKQIISKQTKDGRRQILDEKKISDEIIASMELKIDRDMIEKDIVLKCLRAINKNQPTKAELVKNLKDAINFILNN